LSTHFSAVHSVVIVCAGDIRLLFKFLLKFRNVLKHSEIARKKDIPTALEVFHRFEMKRNGTKHKLTLYENIHATRE